MTFFEALDLPEEDLWPIADAIDDNVFPPRPGMSQLEIAIETALAYGILMSGPHKRCPDA